MAHTYYSQQVLLNHNNEILLCMRIWMNLDDIIVNEIN